MVYIKKCQGGKPDRLQDNKKQKKGMVLMELKDLLEKMAEAHKLDIKLVNLKKEDECKYYSPQTEEIIKKRDQLYKEVEEHLKKLPNGKELDNILDQIATDIIRSGLTVTRIQEYKNSRISRSSVS